MKAPRVAVFSAGKNMATTLRPTLESVHAQTFSDWTHTYLDIGSVDASLSIAEEFSRKDPRFGIREITSTMRAEAYNIATRESASPYFAFLDPDDRWQPEYLERLVSLLESRPEASFAFSAVRAVTEAGEPCDRPVNDPLPPEGESVDLRVRLLFEFNIIMAPSCILVRRDAFECCGGWPLGMPYPYLIDDNLLWQRLGGIGPCVACPQQLVDYVVRPGGSSQTVGQRGRFEILRLLWLDCLLRENLIPPLPKDAERRFVESQIGLLLSLLVGPDPPALHDDIVVTPSPKRLLLRLLRRFPSPGTARLLIAGYRSWSRRGSPAV